MQHADWARTADLGILERMQELRCFSDGRFATKLEVANMPSNKPVEKAHGTVDQVADKLHDVVDKAAESLGTAEERLRGEAREAAGKVREGKEFACTRGEELVGKVTDYVRENPLTALGIAFVAGSIFSALNRRR